MKRVILPCDFLTSHCLIKWHAGQRCIQPNLGQRFRAKRFNDFVKKSSSHPFSNKFRVNIDRADFFSYLVILSKTDDFSTLIVDKESSVPDGSQIIGRFLRSGPMLRFVQTSNPPSITLESLEYAFRISRANPARRPGELQSSRQHMSKVRPENKFRYWWPETKSPPSPARSRCPRSGPWSSGRV